MQAQLCLTLCNPMYCIPPGSSVHGIFRQEYRNGLPSPPLGNLPDPGIEPVSPASHLAGKFFTMSQWGSHVGRQNHLFQVSLTLRQRKETIVGH